MILTIMGRFTECYSLPPQPRHDDPVPQRQFSLYPVQRHIGPPQRTVPVQRRPTNPAQRRQFCRFQAQQLIDQRQLTVPVQQPPIA